MDVKARVSSGDELLNEKFTIPSIITTPNPIDFNTFTTPGIYYVGSSHNGDTNNFINNGPIDNWGTLFVSGRGGTLFQLFFADTHAKIFHRYCRDSSGREWSDWATMVGGGITDIESVGGGFIRFKNGYQICFGSEVSGNMDHGSTGGGIMPISVDSNVEIIGGTKTITFPVPFNDIPVIAISPASINPYQTSNSGTLNPPAAWYHHESTTGFIAELSSAVKLTWIAIGNWK